MAKPHLKMHCDGHVTHIAKSLRTARAWAPSASDPHSLERGVRFTQERKRLRLRLGQVAKRLHMTVPVIRLYEQGAKPGIAQCEGLRSLGFDINYLFTGHR